MKKLLLILESKPSETEYDAFRAGMNDIGVLTFFCVHSVDGAWKDQVMNADDETLLATDDVEIYRFIRSNGKDALCIAKTEDDVFSFDDARYIIFNPYDAEPEYYNRVWMRFNDIPWVIRETKRLIIRETIEDDAEVFYEFYKNPEITKYTRKMYEDLNEEKKYIREYRDKVYAVQGFGIWTLIRKEDRSIIGRAGLVTRAGFDDVEAGYVLGYEYQHKGYATEALAACLEIAKELSFDKVYALTDGRNDPSLSLLRRLGFNYKSDSTVDGQTLQKWEIRLP